MVKFSFILSVRKSVLILSLTLECHVHWEHQGLSFSSASRAMLLYDGTSNATWRVWRWGISSRPFA